MVDKTLLFDVTSKQRFDAERNEYFYGFSYFTRLVHDRKVAFPIKLYKQERPDFVAECKGKTVGIEISRLTSGAMAIYESDDRFRDTLGAVTPLEFDEHPAHRASVAKSACVYSNPDTMFRSPNEIVANWIKIATRRIHEKFTKLNEPDWRVCDENHLVLIETETQPTGTAANGKLPTLAKILGEQTTHVRYGLADRPGGRSVPGHLGKWD